MGVFHVFKIVQLMANRAKHHIHEIKMQILKINTDVP